MSKIPAGVLTAVKKVRGGVAVDHRKHTADCEVVRIPTPEKVVIPMHYNTFPAIEQDPAIFNNFVKQLNPNIQVVIMNPLEYYKPDFEKVE